MHININNLNKINGVINDINYCKECEIYFDELNYGGNCFCFDNYYLELDRNLHSALPNLPLNFSNFDEETRDEIFNTIYENIKNDNWKLAVENVPNIKFNYVKNTIEINTENSKEIKELTEIINYIIDQYIFENDIVKNVCIDILNKLNNLN